MRVEVVRVAVVDQVAVQEVVREVAIVVQEAVHPQTQSQQRFKNRYSR